MTASKKHIYTKSQHDFIKNNHKGLSNDDLTMLFNKEFGTELRGSQIANYKSNRKWKSGTKAKGTSMFTKEQREFIRVEMLGISSNDLVFKFNKEFGTQYTKEQMQRYKSNHGLRSGYISRWEDGHTPANAGKTWDEYMPRESQKQSMKTTFKKGMKPTNHRKVGSERITVDGYIEIKVSEPSEWRPKHIVEWEKVNGKVPDKHRLIFLDQNRKNIDLNNLKMVSFGTSAVMAKKGMFHSNPEITEAGSLISEILIKSNKLLKRRG